MIPAGRHTWHLPLLRELCQELRPRSTEGNGGVGDQGTILSGAECTPRGEVGLPNSVCGGAKRVIPHFVRPVWTEIDRRACRAKRAALDQIIGLPKYEVCFQGF